MRFDRLRTGANALLIVAALTASGCSSISAPPPPSIEPGTHAVPPLAPTSAKQPDAVIGLLRYAQMLADETPDQRESSVGVARQQVEQDPSPVRYARLAIALGTPAQRLYTPDEAARYAQLALDDDNASWSPATRQYLRDYARLYRRLSADDTDDAHQRIVRLRTKLREAHHKLHALADIEKRLDSKTESEAESP